MAIRHLSRYRLPCGLAILFFTVMVHFIITSPELAGNIQIPVTIPLFPEYLAVTELSNSSEVGHDILNDSDKVKHQSADDMNSFKKNETKKENENIELTTEDTSKNVESERMKSDSNKKGLNKTKLFSYKKKLNLIKEAKSAIELMQKTLAKDSLVYKIPNITKQVISDGQNTNEEHISDYITSDNDIDLTDNLSPSPENLTSESFVSSPGTWDVVKTLSGLSGLVKTEGGFINIKPLVNLTVNTFGLFDEEDGDQNKPFDPTDTKTLLKSIFQIWNPRASNWATKTSRKYKSYVTAKGEFGDKKHPSIGKEDLKTMLGPCGCERTLQVEKERIGGVNMSTCSPESYSRGPGQKVVGFSFYGNPNSTKGKERKYFQGIKENLFLLPTHYPGWTIRVYYDLPPGDPILTELCSLACHNPNLDLCYVRNIPSSGDISKIFAMNWRFFPTLDPQVDAYVSRDLDSRLNSREAAAVAAWFSTAHHFHFMRDHPAHSIEILGSGWGARLGPPGSMVRMLFRESFHEASHDPMFWANRKAYGPDQGFLKRYIWPWAKWSSLSHDSYSCKQFPRTSPFPTRRKEGENNFIAAVVEAKDILRQECPVGCRPPDHKDWTRC